MEQPIACTLTPGEYQDRTGELRRTGGPGAALARADRRRRAARLRRQPETERELRAVIAAEASCCAFLRMDLQPRRATGWCSTSPARRTPGRSSRSCSRERGRVLLSRLAPARARTRARGSAHRRGGQLQSPMTTWPASHRGSPRARRLRLTSAEVGRCTYRRRTLGRSLRRVGSLGRVVRLRACLGACLAAIAGALAPAAHAQTPAVVFEPTGAEQSYVVPSDVSLGRSRRSARPEAATAAAAPAGSVPR